MEGMTTTYLWTSVVIVVGLLVVIKWKRRQRWKSLEVLPGPSTLPFIGNAHMLTGVDHTEILWTARRILEGCSESGIACVWAGDFPYVAVWKAELTEALLSSSKNINKSYDYKLLHSWLGTGLLTSGGDKWRRRRKLLTPTFHFRILEDFLEVFNEQSEILAEQLKDEVVKQNGGYFDVCPFLTLCTLDIICESAMGRQINAQSDKDSVYVKSLYRISEIIHYRMTRPLLWPDFTFNLSSVGREHENVLKTLHGFTEQVIREKRISRRRSSSTIRHVITDVLSGSNNEEKDGRKRDVIASEEKKLPPNEIEGGILGKKRRLAFLDLLLEASEAEDGGLTDLDIREEVDTFMFEGHDTTSAALGWTLFLLGNNPEVQRKVHDELDSIFVDGHTKVTMDDLKDLKYLECVIKESLRLCPSVPAFGRCLSEDIIIDGCRIPAGCTVGIIPVLLHRDPEAFPDPERFDPDRFLPENIAGRHPYAYVPFSAGPRNCIGQRFALMEEKVVLAHVLRKFRINSRMKTWEELEPLAELILRPNRGIVVTLTPR